MPPPSARERRHERFGDLPHQRDGGGGRCRHSSPGEGGDVPSEEDRREYFPRLGVLVGVTTTRPAAEEGNEDGRVGHAGAHGLGFRGAAAANGGVSPAAGAKPRERAAKAASLGQSTRRPETSALTRPVKKR